MKTKFFLSLALVLVGGLLFGCSTSRRPLPDLPVRYHNSEFDLTFYLPEIWKGYSVLVEHWEAPLYAAPDSSSGKIVGTERGPIIVLRHPQWRTNNLYQDIPIMVFTRQQWDEEHQGRFFPYAGGVISELWHDPKYVFGLYSRYNFNDEVKDWKAVDNIINQNRTIHPEPALYPE